MADMLGKTLAHYEVGDRLGEGGSGAVYRGRDLRLDRQVAIKVLAEELRNDELAWGRLLREARLASQLNHPNIAAVYDLGEEDGHAFIVMEFVEGLPLAELIPEDGMPLEQVQRYAVQISEALAYAHQQGVMHGDLKGSNIIVTPEGKAKLLDFGLGRLIPREGIGEVTSSRLPLAEVGATGGTLPYLAPEVLRGSPSSAQSDVWALGVLLYQMATGELPFRGATPFDLSLEIMVGTPEKLDAISEPLRSVLRRCMEKDPSHRFSQAEEVARALKENSASVESAPQTVSSAAAGPVRSTSILKRKGAGWWAGGATAIFVLALAGVYFKTNHKLPQSLPSATPTDVAGNLQTGNPQVKVWVNTSSGTYHCPGSRWYGKTQEGQFMTQKEAQSKGYHAALKRACL
jgi:eukaryotic-like serine/threonine-protein kinase